ncbi:MAG TPA: hypothetical protein VMT99_03945 [Candidatus Paceibacterota bacterium]|nr:hypothetical protein [Candidatus Paceibacterota bacterium]
MFATLFWTFIAILSVVMLFAGLSYKNQQAQRKILKTLRDSADEGEWLTATDISAKTSLEPTFVFGVLSDLENKGEIRGEESVPIPDRRFTIRKFPLRASRSCAS